MLPSANNKNANRSLRNRTLLNSIHPALIDPSISKCYLLNVPANSLSIPPGPQCSFPLQVSQYHAPRVRDRDHVEVGILHMPMLFSVPGSVVRIPQFLEHVGAHDALRSLDDTTVRGHNENQGL